MKNNVLVASAMLRNNQYLAEFEDQIVRLYVP